MTEKFAYLVTIEKIAPLADCVYAAKVPYIVKNPGKNFERIYAGLHEWWGETEEEAESKARAETDKWIAEQQMN